MKTLRLAIEGMHCANCALNIEKHFKEAPGVVSMTVNLATNNGTVIYDENIMNPTALLHVFDDMSFSATVIDDDAPLVDENRRTREHKTRMHERRMFVLAAVLTVAVVCLCMIPGVHHALGLKVTEVLQGRTQFVGVTVSEAQVMLYANIVLMVLTIPVQFICGARFYKGAFFSLKSKMANMDVLVALGTSIAFLFSLWITFEPLLVEGGLNRSAQNLTNEGMPYYETCCMLITFVLLGKLLESRARQSTNQAVEELMNLVPPVAVWVQDDGDIKEIPLRHVVPGFTLQVRPGDNVAVDGVVIDCQAEDGCVYVDESALTGESVPVAKAPGEAVFGGTNNTGALFTMKATAVGTDSMMQRIIRAVEEAQGTKAPVQQLADNVAAVFVPSICAIAIVTFLGWQIAGAVNGADLFMQGLLAMVAVLCVACPCALGLATPTALTVGMGKGAQCGVLIKDGSTLERLCDVDTAIFDKTGTLTYGVSRAEGVTPTADNVDAFAQANELRSEASQVVSLLADRGIASYMVSGDARERALAVAEQAGIDASRVVADVDPLDKGACVQTIMESDARVAMFIGDGINDAPAMALADVGIAMGGGTDVALGAGDVVLMRNALSDIVVALRLAKATMRKVRQNLFWALIYNVIMIPLAAFGIVAPAIAGACMALSSITVVTNSLLLKRFK